MKKKFLAIALTGVVLTGCSTKEVTISNSPEMTGEFNINVDESEIESSSVVETITETEEQTSEVVITEEEIPKVEFRSGDIIHLAFEDSDGLDLFCFNTISSETINIFTFTDDLEQSYTIGQIDDKFYYIDENDSVYELTDAGTDLFGDFGLSIEGYFDISDLMIDSIIVRNTADDVEQGESELESGVVNEDIENLTYYVNFNENDVNPRFIVEVDRMNGGCVDYASKEISQRDGLCAVATVTGTVDDIDLTAFENVSGELDYSETVMKVRSIFDELYTKADMQLSAVVPEYDNAMDCFYYKAVPTHTDSESGYTYDVFEDGIYIMSSDESAIGVVVNGRLTEFEYLGEGELIDSDRELFESVMLEVSHNSLMRSR